MFTSAAEAVGELFSSPPKTCCFQGSSTASTSNLRQGKSDPVLTVAVPSKCADLHACKAALQRHGPRETCFWWQSKQCQGDALLSKPGMNFAGAGALFFHA